MAYTLAGISLGQIRILNEKWYSKATLTPLPDAGPNSTYALDVDGVLHTIVIEGEFAAATVAEVRAFIVSMRALHSGSQYASIAVAFGNELMAETCYIMVESFDCTYDNDFTNKIKYSLTMYERTYSAE
jgi:hypothetical protein